MADMKEAGRAREIAAQAVDPCVTNSVAVAAFWIGEEEELDLQSAYDAIQLQVQEVRKGTLSCVEATLVGQAAALNGIFVDLARRGQASLTRPGNAAERYLRLALKAQNQCRATLGTLADIAGRPSKTFEQGEGIRRIERVIIRSPLSLVRPEAGPPEGENEKNTGSELDD